MTDALAAEWLKIRTMRSAYYALLAAALMIAAGTVLTWAGVSGWDKLPPSRRAHFQAPPMEEVILPAVQFALAVLATLPVTTEFATGMIRTTLTAVPARRRLLAARAAVVAAIALAAGLATEFAMFLAGRAVVGGRPIPGNTGPLLHQVPRVAALGLSVMMVALIALGTATALRSAAGTLVTAAALLFVLPVIAHFLPAPPGATRPNQCSPPASRSSSPARQRPPWSPRRGHWPSWPPTSPPPWEPEPGCSHSATPEPDRDTTAFPPVSAHGRMPAATASGSTGCPKSALPGSPDARSACHARRSRLTGRS